MGSFIHDIDLAELEKELISIRRDLHMHPEVGWTEFRTTVKIIEELEKLNIPFIYGKEIHSREHMYGLPSKEELEEAKERAIKETGREDLVKNIEGGYTGCIAFFEGKNEGPTTALRVDIDCNSVGESTDKNHVPNKLGFASIYKDRMHACGHDGHTAIGVGIAKILAKNLDKLNGKVILIFQPAEEGTRGAYSMVNTDFLKGVNYMLGTHLGLTAKELGRVVVGSKGFLSSTKLDVTMEGKTAHAAAYPELGRNALLAASTAATNLYAIPRHSKGVSRINVGVLNAGTGRNIIPGEAYMQLETRGGSIEINDYMQEYAVNICESAAKMHGCSCNTEIVGITASTECDEEFTEFIVKRAKELEEIDRIETGLNFGAGEDVAFMMNYVMDRGGKATHILVGCDLVSIHHNEDFDFNEDALLIAVKLLVNSIEHISENNGIN